MRHRPTLAVLALPALSPPGDARTTDWTPSGSRELLQELLADGVSLVRTVQPDPCNVSLDLVLDRLDLDCTGHERSFGGVVSELKWL